MRVLCSLRDVMGAALSLMRFMLYTSEGLVSLQMKLTEYAYSFTEWRTFDGFVSTSCVITHNIPSSYFLLTKVWPSDGECVTTARDASISGAQPAVRSLSLLLILSPFKLKSYVFVWFHKPSSRIYVYFGPSWSRPKSVNFAYAFLCIQHSTCVSV